jgi:hypothetical protein
MVTVPTPVTLTPEVGLLGLLIIAEAVPVVSMTLKVGVPPVDAPARVKRVVPDEA